MSFHFLHLLPVCALNQRVAGLWFLRPIKILKPIVLGFFLTAFFISAHPVAALEVAVSIRPLHSLVSAVMDGVGTPALIVQGAGSPHSYILRPVDAKTIASADIIFWAGPELETFLIKPLATISKPGATHIALSATPGLKLLNRREGGTFEPHDESAAHPHANDKKNFPDLHFWLDPENAILMVDEIARQLSDKDPQNAKQYQTNAAAYKQRLEALTNEIQTKLAPVKNRPFIVFHDAYHYFENRFKITVAGSVTINPEHIPSVQRIRQLREKIRTLHAACIFSEPQFQSKFISTLTEGTDIKTGTLDPLGSSIPTGPEQYITLIENLADSIIDCLKK